MNDISTLDFHLPNVSLELIKYLEGSIRPPQDFLNPSQTVHDTVTLPAKVWHAAGAESVLHILIGLYQQQTGKPYVCSPGTSRRDCGGGSGPGATQGRPDT